MHFYLRLSVLSDGEEDFGGGESDSPLPEELLPLVTVPDDLPVAELPEVLLLLLYEPEPDENDSLLPP